MSRPTPHIPGLIGFLDKWQRIHSGGFFKAAKRLAMDKTSKVLIQTFKDTHPSSALSESATTFRAFRNISESSAKSVATLTACLCDFQTSLKVLNDLLGTWPESDGVREFAIAISKSAAEDVRLRESVLVALTNDGPRSLSELQGIIVLVAELENFLVLKAAQQTPLPVPGDIDGCRKFLRDWNSR